ncbi:MAG: hypothetical protein HeimC3_21810 [Candidatus Heimdallarchaeota archaeon LC_3]|nr:MAG: hypothetical protein HeimC3_21810 [Candidatus Heimdallarchaeota archaeon LC_3]
MNDKASSEINPQSEKEDIKEEMIIEDPSAVSLLDHRKKQELLLLLIEKEMNILQLNKATDTNPGTIKRHIDQLASANLVKIARIEQNNWGVKMKFYRASAKKFTIKYSWPN